MAEKKLYPSEEIHVKEEFSSYVTFENISGGHKTRIKIPNKCDINLTVYDLIPGISVIVEHSNLIDIFRSNNDILYYEHSEDSLLLNYVAQGQCQYELEPDKYLFIKEKYINVYIKELNPHSFSYIGDVTLYHIIINKKQFKEFAGHNKEFNEIIHELFESAKKENCTIFKAPNRITEIIEEFSKFEIKTKKTAKLFFELKALECLLVLYENGVKDEKNVQRTYSDATIRVVRNIKNSLSRNIASYVSLDSLSMSYGINLTTLKNCFKDMYGKPLYTWYKEYKFYRARELIKNTDYPISKIANMIGYKSSSKFTKAFKKEVGLLPSSYRKNKK